MAFAPAETWISRLLLVACLAGLTACTQSTNEEAALLSGDSPVPRDAKYPDFSKPLTSAMDQMSDEDARKMDMELAGLARQRRSGAISEAEYERRVAEMRKLKAEMPTKPST